MSAIEDAISHWEQEATRTNPFSVGIVRNSCPLCEAYWPCNDCPIKLRTGRRDCAGTPFKDAKQSLENWRKSHLLGYRDSEREDAFNVWQIHAHRFIEFLKSLRPVNHEQVAEGGS